MPQFLPAKIQRTHRTMCCSPPFLCLAADLPCPLLFRVTSEPLTWYDIVVQCIICKWGSPAVTRQQSTTQSVCETKTCISPHSLLLRYCTKTANRGAATWFACIVCAASTSRYGWVHLWEVSVLHHRCNRDIHCKNSRYGLSGTVHLKKARP